MKHNKALSVDTCIVPLCKRQRPHSALIKAPSTTMADVVDYRGSGKTQTPLEETPLLPGNTSRPPEKKYGSAEEAFDEALSRVPVGAFHLVLIAVCGWAIASDSVEIQCISFVTPQLDSSNSNSNKV